MEEKKENNGTGCLIVFFIIIAIILMPIIIGVISNNIKETEEANHKNELIKEGKTKTSNEVINEIMELLKNRNETQLMSYLSKDFIYYDSDNLEHKYMSSLFEDLTFLSSIYEIEQRGDTSLDNIATYRIYWNVVEVNKAKGIDKTESTYCLQTITIVLKKKIKSNIITYEIEKIILKDR